ncbi:MAG: hypothetical protein JWL83_3322 [Actinomycetia bacterium]|nr:hypothetical protein [Actinomycetes bacterium]
MPATKRSQKRSSILKWLLGGTFLVGVVVAVGVWYFFVRDDAPPAAKLVERPTVAAKSGPDGSWTVAKNVDTFAGYRIKEHFGALDHTAVVRTPAVTGNLTLAGTKVGTVNVTADLTQAESKDTQPPGVFPVSNRIQSMRTDGLQTNQFPTAKFALSAPITLAGAPKSGVPVSASATGQLTLHGVTKSVTIPIKARWNGKVIDVTGSVHIALADYSITPPQRNFVRVDNNGTIEFQVTFAKQ